MQYDKLPIGDTAGTRIPADRDHSLLFSAAENGAGPGDMKEPTALPPLDDLQQMARTRHAFLREPAQYGEKQQQAEQRPDRMRHAYPPPSLFLHALHARRWAATAHIRRQSLQYVAQRQRIQIHTSSRNTP